MNALRAWTVAILLVAVAACGGKRPPPAGPGAVAPAAAVERFLQLVGEQRYIDMGWVFGTDAGPVMEQWPQPEVEQRMYALARVLVHDSYVVGPSRAVPGRIGHAESFVVTIRDGNRVAEVPFTVVRGSGDRWYVEKVDLQAVTGIS